MATILLTGVTGTVGSIVAPLLKSKGHKLIYLVRPKNGQNSQKRLSEVLKKTEENAIVWDGDVALFHIGVEDSVRHQWKGKIDKIVNCAASIRLDGGFSKITTQVNVDGVRNLLALAEELQIPEFHQVSTAYVAGNADYFSEDDFDIGQMSRNHYERTKKEAERLVRTWRYGKYSIYRLGIVVGDYNTGCIPSFNGYYVFASSLWHLKNEFSAKTKEEKEQYEKEGVGLDIDGTLILPIYLNFSPDSTLNIVPIDWVAEMVSELVGVDACNKVFHIVHPHPKKARWINNVSLKHLGIKGFYYGDFADYSSRIHIGRFQKLFDRRTQQYRSYTTHECKFETANALYALGGRYKPPPEIDEMFVFTILDYAKSEGFGRKKEEPAVASLNGARG